MHTWAHPIQEDHTFLWMLGDIVGIVLGQRVRRPLGNKEQTLGGVGEEQRDSFQTTLHPVARPACSLN